MKVTRTLDEQEARATVDKINSEMNAQSQRMANNLSASQTGTLPSFTPLWQLPPKLPVFTGRKQPLFDLMQIFVRSPQQLLIQQAPQITGTGGIGKTQLAIQFVHQLLAAKQIETVIWLNADTSGIDQINIEFLQLARALGIDTRPLDQAGIVRCVYQVLSQHPKVLVVFDSATKYEDVAKYCPPDNSCIRLLVTTRDDQCWVAQFAPCPLGIFSVEEAVEYILTVLNGRNVLRQDAEKLALCLGCFPLALAQATGYLLTRNIDIDSYIDLYDSKKATRKKLLDVRPVSSDPHQETLWIAVNLSLEHIQDVNTQNIVASLSYLAPEMPILGDFVESWTQETVQNQQAIRTMRQLGIIATDRQKKSIRMHQMVQEVIRLNHEVDVKQTILDGILGKLFDYLNASNDPLESENRLLVMMAHALSVNTELLKHRCFESLVLMVKLAFLETKIIGAKYILGQYQDALRRGLIALEIFDSIPGLENLIVATLLSKIGLCHQGLGNPKEALAYHERAHEISKSKLQGTEVESSMGIINIAACYTAMGKIQKAHELLSSILPKLENSSELSKVPLLVNLSITYRELGDSDTSISLLKRALVSQQKLYGENHVEVAQISGSLAAIYAELDQANLALPLIEKALEINEARYGKDHLIVAQTLDVMGNVFCGVGRPIDAKNVLQRALQIRVQQLGAHHPEVALTKFNLANAIMDLADTEGAKRLLDEALQIQQQYYGGYSPEAGRTLHILGNTYHDQGNLDKAIESMTLAIKILERNFGAEHRELAKVYNDISCVYLDRRTLSSARESSESALRIFEKTLGPDHLEVARTLNNLANICRAENQIQKAPSLLERALSIFEKQLGPDHLDLGHPLVNIGGLYLKLKEYGKAKQYFVRALNIYMASFQTTAHPDVAITQLQLARAEAMSEDYAQSYEHSAAAYQFYNQTFGQNHVLTQDAYKLNAAVAQHLHSGAVASRSAPRSEVDLLEDVLRRDQAINVATCIKLVEICLQVKQPIMALQFISIVQDTSENTELKKLTVRCYLETGEIESAMRFIDLAIDIELRNSIKRARQEKTDLLLKVEAFDSNNQVTDRSKIEKARFYMQLFQFENAIPLLQSVVDTKPQSELIGPALYQLAMCQYHQQEYTLALENLTRSQKIRDNNQVRDLFLKINMAMKVVPQLMRIIERAYVSATINN